MLSRHRWVLPVCLCLSCAVCCLLCWLIGVVKVIVSGSSVLCLAPATPRGGWSASTNVLHIYICSAVLPPLLEIVGLLATGFVRRDTARLIFCQKASGLRANCQIAAMPQADYRL